jgi:hypothetical protein
MADRGVEETKGLGKEERAQCRHLHQPPALELRLRVGQRLMPTLSTRLERLALPPERHLCPRETGSGPSTCQPRQLLNSGSGQCGLRICIPFSDRKRLTHEVPFGTQDEHLTTEQSSVDGPAINSSN